jgi:hypothetical protein
LLNPEKEKVNRFIGLLLKWKLKKHYLYYTLTYQTKPSAGPFALT